MDWIYVWIRVRTIVGSYETRQGSPVFRNIGNFSLCFSHFQMSSIPTRMHCSLKAYILTMELISCPETSINLRFVIWQKKKGLIYTAAEAWKLTISEQLKKYEFPQKSCALWRLLVNWSMLHCKKKRHSGLLTLTLSLTLILLTWTIWRAPTNASKWRMGFNSAFKGLMCR